MKLIEMVKECERDLTKNTYNLIVSNYFTLNDMHEIVNALEIADRLEKADASKTLYDYCVKCGICTQLNDTCKHRKNIHIGYNQALADIRGDTE